MMLDSNDYPAQSNSGKAPLFGGKDLSPLWCCCLLLVCFSPILEAVVWSGLGVIDEAVACLFLAVLGSFFIKKGKIDISVFLFLVVMALIVGFSILVGRNDKVVEVLTQGFLMSKLFIFLFFGKYFLSQDITLKFFKIFILLTLLGLALNIAAPGVFLQWGLNEKIREEFTSFNRMGGFQLNANRVAHLLALIAFASAEMLKVKPKTYWILLLLSALGLIFTGGRLGMAIFAMGLALKLLSKYKTDIRILLIVLISPFFAYIAYYAALIIMGGEDGLQNDIGYFRLFMLFEGSKLAADYFPFGSGLGTFGTKFAYDVGVYQETRVADTFFYRMDTALYDCNLASLVGEVGFVFTFALLCILFRSIWSCRWKFESVIWSGILLFVSFSVCFESFLSNSICAASITLFIFGLAPAAKRQAN